MTVKIDKQEVIRLSEPMAEAILGVLPNGGNLDSPEELTAVLKALTTVQASILATMARQIRLEARDRLIETAIAAFAHDLRQVVAIACASRH